MSNLTPLPASLRKRRAGKGLTGLVALIAGIALAASVFTLTQPGSASTMPVFEPPGNPLEEGDVTVEPLILDGLETDPKSYSFTFTNSNVDGNAAHIYVDDIRPPEGEEPTFFDDIHVTLTEGDRTLYEGLLKDLPSDIYMGEVAGNGGTLPIDVEAYLVKAQQGAEDDPEMTVNFEIDYDVDDTARPTTPPVDEEGCPPGTGPLSGVVQQVSDGIADGDPTGEAGPLVDGIDTINCELIVTLEGAAGGGAPEIPVP